MEELCAQLNGVEKQVTTLEKSVDFIRSYLSIFEKTYRGLSTEQRMYSKKRGCRSCSGKESSFLSKKQKAMNEKMLEEQLKSIRRKAQDRIQRRINLTRDTLNFLEANKGQMCGGCVEQKMGLLRKKLESLEKIKV